MLLAGYSVTEAARLLEISPNTVCGARQRVMEKWEVEGMVGLIKEAIKRGYVELDSDSPLTYRDGNYEEIKPVTPCFRDRRINSGSTLIEIANMAAEIPSCRNKAAARALSTGGK